MKRRMSFSAALAFLEQHDITVEHLGRHEIYGCLMWRIEGRELDKYGVVAFAERMKVGML